jgi:hypothetical protein
MSETTLMNKRTGARVAALIACGALVGGCRERPSENPPIHPNLNMDFQTNFKAQEENTFFEDGRSNRPQVPGTVARGTLKENTEVYFGKNGDEWVTRIPVPVTKEFVLRGQERYNIYCTPCHAATGAGDGIVVQRGMLRPSSFHDQRIVDMPEGQIYDAMLNGVRGNMPSYAYAIPVQDRWAIVAYMRALQLSQRASLDQVPADIATQKGWTK